MVDMYMCQVYTMHMKEAFRGLTGFEWDDGNRSKSQTKHGVSPGEAEQLFFNEPLVVIDDTKHSKIEKRFAAFGVTDAGRRLVAIYTIRSEKIRIISARDMHKKERAFYENES